MRLSIMRADNMSWARVHAQAIEGFWSLIKRGMICPGAKTKLCRLIRHSRNADPPHSKNKKRNTPKKANGTYVKSSIGGTDNGN